jgi:Predicted nucleic acid-binding protein, contains PIN domain
MTRIALLDVNVLVALFNPDHVHYEAAHAWFSENRPSVWATSPLTENGLVRILSNIAYASGRESALSIQKRLGAFCASGNHLFWPDQLSLRDERRFNLAGVTHKQITDVYLLGLATERGGRLATFDRRVQLQTVIGADQDNLEIIPT